MTNVSTTNFDRRRLLKFARQTLFLILAATAVSIGISAGFNNLQTAFSGRNIAASFVYSSCIGAFVSAAMVFVISRNYSESAFPRLLKLTVTIFAATFAGMILANAVFAVVGLSAWTKILSISSGQIWFSLTIALIFGFSSYFYELSQAHLAIARENLRNTELEAARIQTLASEAQLASLESRLQPHFLFNTLNSIAALIREDADLAEKTVERLAALLRYSLDADQQRLVTLAQELKITRDYLDIESVRFGARLNFVIDVDPQFEAVKIPPFALQTVIENSIKHVAARRPGAIHIKLQAARRGEFLEIEISDDGDGFSVANLLNGHGLDNLQKRLSAIFDHRAALEINAENKGNGAHVMIRVPFEKKNVSETARLFS